MILQSAPRAAFTTRSAVAHCARSVGSRRWRSRLGVGGVVCRGDPVVSGSRGWHTEQAGVCCLDRLAGGDSEFLVECGARAIVGARFQEFVKFDPAAARFSQRITAAAERNARKGDL